MPLMRKKAKIFLHCVLYMCFYSITCILRAPKVLDIPQSSQSAVLTSILLMRSDRTAETEKTARIKNFGVYIVEKISAMSILCLMTSQIKLITSSFSKLSYISVYSKNRLLAYLLKIKCRYIFCPIYILT